MEKIAETLTAMGHPISADTVHKELVKLGFSRQFNRKSDEGSKHPDRDAQFEHINAKVVAAQTNHHLSSRSIRRKKSWSATSRTAVRTTVGKARRAVSTCMTSSTRSWARRRPMASTT
jgi:Rhodopirellula transposase DDE domain